jgi:hypothetical protein
MPIFKSLKNIIDPESVDTPWVERIYQKPSFMDFQLNRIALFNPHFERIKDSLSKNNIFCIIGPMSSGKTWLSYALGYYFQHEKTHSHTRFCVISSNFSSEDAWNEILSVSTVRSEYLFILDDCHENIDECESLLTYALESKNKKLFFIFTMRRAGKFLLRDIQHEDIFYHLSKEKNTEIASFPGKNEINSDHAITLSRQRDYKTFIKQIYEKYAAIKRININFSDDEFENLFKKTSINLSWAILFLKSWEEKKNKSIAEIDQRDIFDLFWSHDGEIGLEIEKNRSLLSAIATSVQFNVNFNEQYLSSAFDADTIKKYKKNGIIREIQIKGITHLYIPPNIANLILETNEVKIKDNPQDLQRKQVKLFTDYILTGPDNWYMVLANLSHFLLD